jgi:hypothetical protein
VLVIADPFLAHERADVLEGQEATVLQLPAQPATVAEAKAQERVAHVG